MLIWNIVSHLKQVLCVFNKLFTGICGVTHFTFPCQKIINCGESHGKSMAAK